MIWLSWNAYQDLKVLLSLSDRHTDKIIGLSSKITKQKGCQDNYHYKNSEQVLRHNCHTKETEDDFTLIRKLFHSIVVLSVIRSDLLMYYDLLMGLSTMHFSEDEIQKIDNLTDKLRKNEIARNYDHSSITNVLVGWGLQVYHELLHSDETDTLLIDEIYVN
jgi:hypothetical protein